MPKVQRFTRYAPVRSGESVDQVILSLKARLMAVLMNKGYAAVSDYTVEVWTDPLTEHPRVSVEVLAEEF